MASITIINKTNVPINSTAVYAGVNSSWRNKINPTEFFVHSASPAVQYTLKVNYCLKRDDLYHSNWSRVAELIGLASLDLIAIGLSVVGLGMAVGAVTGASTALGFVAGTVEAGVGASAFAVDIVALGINVRDFVVDRGSADTEWTDIWGHHDVVFVAEGGMDINENNGRENPAKLKPLTLRKISQDEFERMKRTNQIYERSKLCHAIRFDEKGDRYYITPDGKHIYNPDGDEYYKAAGGTHVKYEESPPSNPARANVEWTKGITGNDRGEWQTEVHVDPRRFANGIEVREQDKYGVINARLLDGDKAHEKETFWTSKNMGDDSPTNYRQQFFDPECRIFKVEVREEEGYGITDIRFHVLCQEGMAGCVTDWLTENNEGESSKIHIRECEVPKDHAIVGLQGKEQGGFGLVDIKFAYSPFTKSQAAS
ncbi:hypothetical protein [Melittangium boletus]|uniref:Uncharacterized protein n=1 Tax=Melittangium boletus DSM 14713 TaxID=1294270 RepID=A0A250IG36_9BACT|nr:hypothetical protein [Melittangium boletus]ATB29896.1 hypothetical protein MEBOL_003351 [Melittangium boletus DSM 14713]